MRRTAPLTAALATVVALVAAPGPASAGVRTPLSTPCQGHTWVDHDYVTSPGSKLHWGQVWLCRNGGYYFSIYTHFDAHGRQAPMPVNFFANAWIHRYNHGEDDGRSSCDGGNGNNHVVPGEIWCRTNTIGRNGSSNATFQAYAYVYHWNGSNWVQAASGLTHTHS